MGMLNTGQSIMQENPTTHSKEWRLNGALHRTDGPAVERARYSKEANEWWVNGMRHRDDGPAVEYPSGTQIWYLNGEKQKELYIGPGKRKTWKEGNGSIHRDDGPAIEFEDGSKEWYQHGCKHRVGAPASISSDGVEAWFNEGELSRIGGPAIEGSSSGRKEWWIDGVPFRSSNDYWKYIIGQIEPDKKSLAELVTTLEAYNLLTKHPLEIPGINTIIGNIQERVWKNGVPDVDTPYLRRLPLAWLTQIEFPNDVIAKLNDQAQEHGKSNKIKKIFHTQRMRRMADNEGVKHLIDNGEIWENASGDLHRLNGPAVIFHNGVNEWWVNGKRHRLNGPAVEFPNGDKQWFVNGNLIKKRTRNGNALIWEDPNNNRHRDYGPAVEFDDGEKEWWQHGVLHREDGPAIIKTNGQEEWYRNNQLHREDGPAYICANGYEAWYLKGQSHRVGGPAVTYPRGISNTEHGDFYINGVKFNDESKYWDEVAKQLGFTQKNLKTMFQRLPNPLSNVITTLQKHKILDSLEPSSAFAQTILQTMQTILDANKCSMYEIRRIPYDWLTRLVLPPEIITKINDQSSGTTSHGKMKKFFKAQRIAGNENRIDGGMKNKTTDGAVRWYDSSGKLYREDGPAVEYTDGRQEWWIDGEQCAKNHYWQLIFTEGAFAGKSLAAMINILLAHNYFKYNSDPLAPDCDSWVLTALRSRPVSNKNDIDAIKKIPYEWLTHLSLTPEDIATINQKDAKPVHKFFSTSLPVLQSP